MRSALTKAEHPWRAEQKGRNERSKSKIFQWMNGSGRVEGGEGGHHLYRELTLGKPTEGDGPLINYPSKRWF